MCGALYLLSCSVSPENQLQVGDIYRNAEEVCFSWREAYAGRAAWTRKPVGVLSCNIIKIRNIIIL
jgi:hypothetical protein